MGEGAEARRVAEQESKRLRTDLARTEKGLATITREFREASAAREREREKARGVEGEVVGLRQVGPCFVPHSRLRTLTGNPSICSRVFDYELLGIARYTDILSTDTSHKISGGFAQASQLAEDFGPLQ